MDPEIGDDIDAVASMRSDRVEERAVAGPNEGIQIGSFTSRTEANAWK